MGLQRQTLPSMITLDSDGVFGEDLLRGNVESDGPEVDHLHLVNAGDDEEQSRAHGATLKLTLKHLQLFLHKLSPS